MSARPNAWRVPAVIRGAVVDDAAIELPGRGGGATLLVPDARSLVDRLTLGSHANLADLYTLRLEDIVAFLSNVGQRLALADNPSLMQAFEVARLTSGLSDGVLREQFRAIPEYFEPERVRKTAESVGVDYLEGWVEQRVRGAGAKAARVRALGSRVVHIIAGNVPGIGVVSVINGAITRCDTIIKAPSNDPLTVVAIAKTMIELDPEHPLTRHLSVAYWKGGDSEIEARIYDPRKIDKVVAWGGYAGIKSVTRYLQPGLDLITLDPKQSGSLIGPEAFESESTLKDVAGRLARDIGILNQEACFNTRVAYVMSGTDDKGLAGAVRLGELTFEALQRLPAHESTAHKSFDARLKLEIDGLRFVPDEFRVFGGKGSDGAVIVSLESTPVDFASSLACRVANIVPIDHADQAISKMDTSTQTLGVYPQELITALRDTLALRGVQRVVALGDAGTLGVPGTPQDGLELLRRMCRWCVDESPG